MLEKHQSSKIQAIVTPKRLFELLSSDSHNIQDYKVEPDTLVTDIS